MSGARVQKGSQRILSQKQIDSIAARLLENKPVRRSFPGWGRLHIDRQLPFLCVYRRKSGSEVEGTDQLILSEAAYALVPDGKSFQVAFVTLLERIVEIMVERFGAYLILEVWQGGWREEETIGTSPRSAFIIHQSPDSDLGSTVNALQEGLMEIDISGQKAKVDTRIVRRVAPPGLASVLASRKARELGCRLLGLEVRPVYLNAKTQESYPLLLRSIRKQLGRVLDQTFYEFAHNHTTHQPVHFHALGRRAMVKAVWEVDRRLAAVSNSFDLLWQVTPVNAESAWAAFSRRRCSVAPDFLYRPRVVDPGRMKRSLYNVPLERVEDPTLMHLLLEKQTELDRQLTMLADLGTKQFLYESLQLYGEVPAALVEIAEKILEVTPSRSRTNRLDDSLSAGEFAAMARREIAWYASKSPGFKGSVQVTSDMYSGLMVSRGRLLIGKDTRIPKARAEALLQHELGTHLLTYFNGQAQPFKMLSSGLPGYDELQEGLAVLSEYLVGGLSVSRLRVLAARVIAVQALIDGAGFVEVFRLLDRTHEFTQRTAFTITMRVFRGGGLVKDAVYLRGLVDILKYLAGEPDLGVLFIGKIGTRHIPIIQELLLRKVLKPAPLYPRHLEDADVRVRIERLSRGVSVLELIEKRKGNT